MTASAPPGKPPLVRHLLETSLYVEDPARAQEFYQRLFGFPLAFADQRLSALALPGPAVLLLFRRDAFTKPGRTPGGLVPAHGGAGHLHLCFAIDAADLAVWQERLTTLGVPIESRVHWPRGSESLYFRDPDNHLLELATPGLWPDY
ncbi:MAG: VOC family protein [Rhodospirillales bacterium]|nr:VOC family protein [Rhodospirillales bacterium]